MILWNEINNREWKWNIYSSLKATFFDFHYLTRFLALRRLNYRLLSHHVHNWEHVKEDILVPVIKTWWSDREVDLGNDLGRETFEMAQSGRIVPVSYRCILLLVLCVNSLICQETEVLTSVRPDDLVTESRHSWLNELSNHRKWPKVYYEQVSGNCSENLMLYLDSLRNGIDWAVKS
jgi:hypothetical protein